MAIVIDITSLKGNSFLPSCALLNGKLDKDAVIRLWQVSHRFQQLVIFFTKQATVAFLVRSHSSSDHRCGSRVFGEQDVPF